jgi:hypothetical protein
MKENQNANRLFQDAIESAKRLDLEHQHRVLGYIVAARAKVGDITGAKMTAEMIGASVEASWRRDVALVSIVDSLLISEEPEQAAETARSIARESFQRSEAFSRIISHLVSKGSLAASLSLSREIADSSERARVLLKLALAHVSAGNPSKAIDIAAGIELPGPLDVSFRDCVFNHRVPASWGICYIDGGTLSGHLWRAKQATEIAVDALRLAEALRLSFDEPYSKLFDGFDGDVVRALAREHASSEKTLQAMEWVTCIGSSDGESSQEALHRRVCALLGAAEGILDKMK